MQQDILMLMPSALFVAECQSKVFSFSFQPWKVTFYWTMFKDKCSWRLSTGYWLILESVSCYCDHFLIYCASNLSSNHLQFIHQSYPLWLQQRHLVAKWGETGRKMSAEFCLSVSVSYLKGSLTCHKILQHGADGFISPPKEVMLWIFIALKNPSLAAGFEHTNLGSSGEHDNHYTTENDRRLSNWLCSIYVYYGTYILSLLNCTSCLVGCVHFHVGYF
jgi:hypothetical protein